MRAALAGHLVADVALFERQASDLIDWAKPDGARAGTQWRTQNFASARYRGVEAVLRAPALAGADWTLRASGLRFDATVPPGVVGKYALRPLTRTIGLSSALPTAGAGTLAIDALHAQRAGERGHVQLNARVNLPVGGAAMSVELLNLTGASYLDGAGKAVAGRSAFGGLAWVVP